MRNIIIVVLVFSGAFHSKLLAQINYPSLSPKGVISQVVGNTYLEIEYERPSTRNRKVFGDLVPYGKVWRTGAAYCTKISFDKPVNIGGQAIPAGKYSLFTIPNKEEWIVIINVDTTLYGSYDYNYKKDIVRFAVNPKQSGRYYETLTIDIDLVPNNALIYISWETTSIRFKFETSTDNEVERFIKEQLITGKVKDYDKISGAIDYLYFQGTDYENLKLLAEEAIKINESGFAHRLLMETYERQHYYNEAIDIAQKAIELRKKKSSKDDKFLQRDINNWKNHIERIKRKADN